MTQNPTLAHIPGILARTILRLFARLLFVLASVLLLAGVAVTLASVLLATWRTPRRKRTQLATEIVVAAFELIADARRSRSNSE